MRIAWALCLCATPAALATFSSACDEEIAVLCADDDALVADSLSCLSTRYNELSSDCVDEIAQAAPSAVGPCTQDARALCEDEFTSASSTTTQCLLEHRDELSDACRTKVDHDASRKPIPTTFIESRYYFLTQVIIGFAGVVLSLTLLGSGWAVREALRLHGHMAAALAHMEGGAVRPAGGHHAPPSAPPDESGSPRASAEMARRSGEPLAEGASPIEIEFCHISYWATIGYQLNRPSGRPLRLRLVRKRILHDVCGVLRPGTLTAIMGPSGSGKTTLLELLGGHAPRGAFAGSRMINGVRYPRAAQYDGVMRGQGYVAQRDSAFFAPLTVWETIAYTAALRLPAKMSTHDKMARAAAALRDVELTGVAAARVGGGDAGDGISGGQARRLSIALELLQSSAALLLDEPTSGLDASTSMRIAQTMCQLATGKPSAATSPASLGNATSPAIGCGSAGGSAHGRCRTVVTTIHQPRTDIYGLFDDVVLLATGGELVYAGSAADAAPFLAAAPCLRDALGDCLDEERANPADFLIDVLGLAARQPTMGRPDSPRDLPGRARSSNTLSEDVEARPAAADPATPGTSVRDGLIAHYRASALHRATLQRIGARVRSPGPIIPVHTPCRGAEAALQRRVHTVAMFARRVRRLSENRSDIVLRYIQVVVIGCVISAGFSYHTSKLGKPYQVFMLLLMLSSYAMVLQYVELVPEYFGERAVLAAERRRHAARFDSYVLAAMFTETPRAIAHSALLIALGYASHDMNPNSTNITFCVVGLMLGVSSWQAVIALACVAAPDETAANAVIFLLLGGGTLFGGLLIKLSDLPWYFRIVYYSSVSAVTQRALIVNDFLCCYLSISCAEVVESSGQLQWFGALEEDGLFESGASDSGAGQAPEGARAANMSIVAEAVSALADDGFCPPELAARFEDFQHGNLGRRVLSLMELDKVDNYVELFTIFCILVGARTLSVALLNAREAYMQQLHEANAQQSEAKLRELSRQEPDLVATDADEDCEDVADGGDVELQTLPAVLLTTPEDSALRGTGATTSGVESSEDDAEEDCALLAKQRA